MLADPAQSGVAAERLFQHRSAVHKRPTACPGYRAFDALTQCFQSFTDELVVVAAQRVARDIGPIGIIKAGLHLRGGFAHVVHADGNRAQRTGLQGSGVGTQPGVACHVRHGAMAAIGQPLLQMLNIGVQIEAGDADRLETQFAGPLPNQGCNGVQIGGHGFEAGIGTHL